MTLTILTARANIGHDCIVGNNNIFTPNVGISGNCKIGNNNFFSVFSTMIPNLNCGNDNLIAPGLIIDKDILNKESIFIDLKKK